jgi:beta-N-acetylhexosaminidase
MSLLRDDLHFDGVVAADDMGAAVAVASIPPRDRAVDFIAAGGDLITIKNADLVTPMVNAIASRAASDKTFADQVNKSTKRVLRLKIGAGLINCA